MRQPKLIKPDELIEFALTRRERDVVLKHTFIDAGLEKRLRLTVVSGTRLTVSLTLDDADDLAGFVAAEANHCADSKIKKLLDGVYDRLAHLEIQYTDQPSEQKVAPTLPGMSHLLLKLVRADGSSEHPSYQATWRPSFTSLVGTS